MRETIDFCDDWYFHKGDFPVKYPDYKTYTYLSAKTERMLSGPACKDYSFTEDAWDGGVEFNTDTWERVTLPHDFIVGGIPDKTVNCAFGFLPRDNGWYVKRFMLPVEDKNKRVVLFFEGAAIETTVYMNGCLVKRSFSGYTSFEADVTDFLKFGKINHLAVYVRAKDIHEGWWYEGGGIYRPVHLVKTDKLAVDLWGIFAKPVYVGDKTWRVETKIAVRNDYGERKSAKAVCEIVEKSGKIVATANACGIIDAFGKREFACDLTVIDPDLWSPESPERYDMRVRIYSGRRQTDEQSVKFGFRTYRLDPDKGMFINGKHYKIKGVCGHAECGLTGKAVPDNIHRYKARLLKEMGANGYRTSHYMQSEAFMDALDENGFIVMDETRWFSTDEESMSQLTALIKRDRNRPSVFFWSIGNEEPHHITEEGRRIAEKMRAAVLRSDDSRAIMNAVDRSPVRATVYDESDVAGINYNWASYDEVHKKYPEKPVISSEASAAVTTRGWYYADDPEKGYCCGYDHDTNKSFISREHTWKFVTEREWLLGAYHWNAFEYRGEAEWPRLCSQSGAIDFYLQKKDAFYQNQSLWTSEPMIHLLPHWNFRGMEGKIIPVCAYTNANEAELFLNGRSLGRKKIEKYGHGEWNVPYEAGVLAVRAYDGEKIVATDETATTGRGRKLSLVLDTTDIKANGRDIAVFTCSVLDEEGREVPDAAPTVSFHAEGAGYVYSTGSDVSDHTSLFNGVRKMRAGKISVAVKLKKEAGTLELIAESEGLESARICVEVKN